MWLLRPYYNGNASDLISDVLAVSAVKCYRKNREFVFQSNDLLMTFGDFRRSAKEILDVHPFSNFKNITVFHSYLG